MRALQVLAAAGLLSGCATSTVTLLQDPGGATGAVAVFDRTRDVERGALTVANTQAEVGGRTVTPRSVDPEPYAALFAALPPAPRSYLLYFIEGTTDLTDPSKPVLEDLRRIVTVGSEVQITGHTDTVGTSDSNDRLSYERAVEIRAALVKQGLPVESARVTGRGERQLLVRTADGVDEGRNRRVEVILR